MYDLYPEHWLEPDPEYPAPMADEAVPPFASLIAAARAYEPAADRWLADILRKEPGEGTVVYYEDGDPRFAEANDGKGDAVLTSKQGPRTCEACGWQLRGSECPACRYNEPPDPNDRTAGGYCPWCDRNPDTPKGECGHPCHVDLAVESVAHLQHPLSGRTRSACGTPSGYVVNSPLSVTCKECRDFVEYAL